MGKIMKQRTVYFDILNILSAFAVIMLHCNGIAHTYSDTLAWKQAMAAETLFYFAVPVFFMLSGATLMRYRDKYDTKTFFKKRALRTLIPFIVWTLVFAAQKRIFPWGGVDGGIGLREFISRCFNTRIEPVYWFFIPLFAVYLSMPLISLLADKRKTLWYAVGTGFILTSVCPFLFKVLKIQWNYNLNLSALGGYLLFTVLGYLLSTEDLSKKKRYIIYLLGILSVFLRYFGTWFLSARDGQINKFFFGDLDFYSVFLAAAVFVFVKYLPLNKKIAESKNGPKILSSLSALSFGVYLIHMFIYRGYLKVFTVPCWQLRLLLPFLIYATAALCVYIIRKIPILRHIV